MIRYTPAKQLTLEGFSTPFSQQLSTSNRWVILAAKIPWDKVATNMAKGHSFRESLTHEIDLTSIGISAASGAASGALSTVKAVSTVGKALVKAGELAISATESVARQATDKEGDGKISIAKVGMDVGMNYVIGKATDKVKVFGEGSVDRTLRQVSRGQRALADNVARSTRAAGVRTFEKKLAVKVGANTFTTSLAGNAISALKEVGVDKTQEQLKKHEVNVPFVNNFLELLK